MFLPVHANQLEMLVLLLLLSINCFTINFVEGGSNGNGIYLDSVYVSLRGALLTMSEAEWAAEFDQMSRIGIKSIIVQSTASCSHTPYVDSIPCTPPHNVFDQLDDCTAIYPTRVPPFASPEPRIDSLAPLLAAAARKQMSVRFGLVESGQFYAYGTGQPFNQTYFDWLGRASLMVGTELIARYQTYVDQGVLRGLYISQEIDNREFPAVESQRALSAQFLEPLASLLSSAGGGGFDVSVATYFIPKCGSVDDWRRQWAFMLRLCPSLTTLIVEDSIGHTHFMNTTIPEAMKYVSATQEAAKEAGGLTAVATDAPAFLAFGPEDRQRRQARPQRFFDQIKAESELKVAFRSAWEWFEWISPASKAGPALYEKLLHEYKLKLKLN